MPPDSVLRFQNAKYTEIGDEVLEYMFSGFIRVQHGLDTPSSLLATLKDLIERDNRARNSFRRATFSELERAQLLDLPNAADVARAIKTATHLSHNELLRKAVPRLDELSPSEAKLLSNRYWSDATAEQHQYRAEKLADARRGRIPGIIKVVPEVSLLKTYDRLCQELLMLRLERQALLWAPLFFGPGTPEDKAAVLCAGSRAWIKKWAAEDLIPKASTRPIDTFEYVVYIDADLRRRLDPRDEKEHTGVDEYLLKPAWMQYFCGVGGLFESRFQESVQHGTTYVHAAHVMGVRIQWDHSTDIPSVTKPGTVDEGNEDREHMRYAWPLNPEIDEHAIELLRTKFHQTHFKDGCQRSGTRRLRNVFLVAEPTCLHSVLRGVGYLGGEDDFWHHENQIRDSQRVLAVDPNYPLPHFTYPDGYRGYLWVRVQQLADKFLEMRWCHPDVGLEQLWLAAQPSRNHAFVSMDAEEARKWYYAGYFSKDDYGSLFRECYFDTANDWVIVPDDWAMVEDEAVVQKPPH